jgi:ribosomal protein S12 methylthiotransferase
MPEVDAFFGVDQADDIAEFLSDGKEPDVKTSSALILSSGTFAPLKVAEGCSRRCGFCVIPDIRGPFRSRPYEVVLKEAEDYLSQGIKELLVVAQDLNSYGRDLNDGSYRLPELLKALAGLSESEYRVRPLYLYPTDVDAKLLDTISSDNKICSYFDIPLQHSEDNILRSMGRAGSRTSYLELIQRIRLQIPDAALRTTLIVGYPGESDKDFRRLLDFVEEAAFDHLGAFAYSDEEGTRAFEMPDKVDEDVTQRRLEDLLGIQAEISRERNEMLLGGEYRALVDEVSDDGVVARLERQAPDVDGLTYLKDCGDVLPGSFVDIEITDASDYDLEGHCI